MPQANCWPGWPATIAGSVVKLALKHNLCWLMLCSVPATGLSKDAPVGMFDSATATPPSPWQLLRFADAIPATQYRIRDWDGHMAIEAQADASMAILARPVSIDLNKTPVLCWLWRVDKVLAKADMQNKAGDDYAARVYLSLSLPDNAISFTTRMQLSLARLSYGDQLPDAAINYVWDNRYPVGTQMDNAYTAQTRMLVMQSGNANSGHWIQERRNVRQDAEQLFTTREATVLQLGVASDTDNTKENAHAGFAELHFVSETESCQFSQSQDNELVK